MDRFFKWVQEMYPDKTADECMQRLEFLVKQDVIKLDDDMQIKYTLPGVIHDLKVDVSFAADDGDTEYLPTCQQPKFKPGDKVRVIDYEIKDHAWYKRSGLKNGDILTVESLNGYDGVQVEENWYGWHNDWIEPVE